MSPTPTLVLDKLLFMQILYLILKPSIAAAVKVFNISKITSFISKYQESINTGDWLESTGKWTLLWISKEVPAPGRCHLVMVKPKSGDRLTAWKC